MLPKNNFNFFQTIILCISKSKNKCILPKDILNLIGYYVLNSCYNKVIAIGGRFHISSELFTRTCSYFDYKEMKWTEKVEKHPDERHFLTHCEATKCDDEKIFIMEGKFVEFNDMNERFANYYFTPGKQNPFEYFL